MNKYEMVYIVDAQLPQAEKDEVARLTAEGIAKIEGKVINSNIWLEKQRFTFPMKKVWEGTYYLVNFEAIGPSVAKFRQTLKLNERILRSLIIRADE